MPWGFSQTNGRGGARNHLNALDNAAAFFRVLEARDASDKLASLQVDETGA